MISTELALQTHVLIMLKEDFSPNQQKLQIKETINYTQRPKRTAFHACCKILRILHAQRNYDVYILLSSMNLHRTSTLDYRDIECLFKVWTLH